MSSGLSRPGLLVSVRSADEARAALVGGADLIDIKEPSRGPLGPAEPEVIDSIVAAVAGRVPVSAAPGEWLDWVPDFYPKNVNYIKWGLSRMATVADSALFHSARTQTGARPVLVAYADFVRADSPLPTRLAHIACEYHFSAFLIDTAVKDGSSLLDWIEPAKLACIRFELADAGVQVA